jgi:aminoglycoside phosphotransferase (APT) family kinase protein
VSRGAGGAAPHVQRSTRDAEQLRAGLRAWLAGKLPAGANPTVAPLETTDATGMSSETLMFTATWSENGERRDSALVARVAPDPADWPLLPSYDLHQQFLTLRGVADHTDVPVPQALWSEPDPSVLGAPFFVMRRVAGTVPPDLPPYPFDTGWVFEANAEQRKVLQDSTIDVIARLHMAPDPTSAFSFLELDLPGDTPLRRHVAHTRAWYELASENGARRSPLLEEGFRWVEDNFPGQESEPLLCWGDARLSNILYQDFRPAAVLDWEMAVLGPAEIDLAWLIYTHSMFQERAVSRGLTGMPEFLRPADVVDTYEALTGRAVRDLEFYLTYSALRFGVVYLRANLRRAHFGEIAVPDDLDTLIGNGRPLRRMLAGSYWS